MCPGFSYLIAPSSERMNLIYHAKTSRNPLQGYIAGPSKYSTKFTSHENISCCEGETSEAFYHNICQSGISQMWFLKNSKELLLNHTDFFLKSTKSKDNTFQHFMPPLFTTSQRVRILIS